MTDSSIFKADLLAGQSAVVTGGGTGIGLAIARELGRLGAYLILAARHPEPLEQAVATLEAESVAAHWYPLNIRRDEEVEAFFEKVSAAHGVPDILVNNAGGQFAAPALDVSPNGFRAVVDLNLHGTWYMSSAYARRVIESGRTGTIVNIVLCLGSGVPGMVHSAAARAGVINMTKTLASEWGPRGLTVNAVAPGTIDTPALASYDRAELEAVTKRLPARRMGSAEEVAQAVAYLTSPAARFITGTVLEIDGGEHLIGALPQTAAR